MFLAVGYFCFLFALQAQERVFVIDSAHSVYKLNDFTYFLEKKNQSIKPENLLESPFFEKMKLFSSHNTPPQSNYIYWYKLKITNQVKNNIDFVFEIGDFPVLEFSIFNQKKQLIRSQKIGKGIPFSQRASPFKASSFPFTILYQDTITLVCRVPIDYALEQFKDVQIELSKPYIENKLDRVGILFFFQGAMFLMFFYNLFFFFMVRDRAYLYYTLYILGMAFVSFDDTYSLTKEYPYWTEVSINFMALFITLSYAQFIRYFLNIPQIRPVLNRY